MFASQKIDRHTIKTVKRRTGDKPATHISKPKAGRDPIGQTKVLPPGQEGKASGMSESKLAYVMAEIDKMAEEGGLSEEAVAQIKANVEEAKQANIFSTLASGGKNVLSKGQFGRMARGHLGDESQIDALYSAISSGKGKGVLGNRQSTMDAINVAAAKAKAGAGEFAGHLDSFTGGGKGGSGVQQAGLVVGLPAAAILADAAYNASQAGNNYANMIHENPELADLRRKMCKRPTEWCLPMRPR